MASGFGKKSSGDEGMSIEELEKNFNEATSLIRTIIGGVKDKRDLRSEDKQKLATQYLRASQLAQKIGERHTNAQEADKYKELSVKFGKKATEYGSTVSHTIPKTTFDDVKGLDDVKKLVESFVYIASHQDIVKYYKIEGGLGMLMYGAPGTGKTMFAEAIANKLQLPLFIITPADIFKSYVGESEQAVRQLFDEMDACADGAILFVDECESIFSKRGPDTKDYKAAVTTELLQRINGFGVNGSKRIMIAATNRPDVIDPAYLRFKRFSHRVHVPPPDITAKRAIIEGKLSGIALDGVTTEDLVEMSEAYTKSTVPGTNAKVTTWYYSAADLCGIIEEACRLALEEMQSKGLPKPIPLRRDMFEKAFKKLRPSISVELLKQYENFQ
ncbi:MAG: ATP-binding protein [Clostridiales bacterium]|nr:ATP-binding protein [Clostridiales bacterium]